MTLTLNPSASIRPLGEEHLRMFRRATESSSEPNTKISVPKHDEIPKFKIIEGIRCSFKEAREIARKNGGHLPTLKKFILATYDFRTKTVPDALIKGGIWFLDEQSIIAPGLNRIDFLNGALIPVIEAEWRALPYEQKAKVSKNNTPRPYVASFGYTDFSLSIGVDTGLMPLAQLLIIKNRKPR